RRRPGRLCRAESADADACSSPRPCARSRGSRDMPARRVRVRGRREIPGRHRAANGRCSWRPTIAGRPQPLQCEPMQEFDFAIVGAGIAGVSLAYHLAPQAKVIILERENVPAYHTTGRSAALHSETYGSAEIRAITVAAGRFYREPPDGFTDHPLLTPRGAVIAGRADQAAAMDRAAAEYQQMVPSVRRLSLKETIAVQPL